MTWNRTDAVLAEQGGHGLYNPGLSLSLFSVDFSLHSTILNMSPSSESAQPAPTSSAPNVQSGAEVRWDARVVKGRQNLMAWVYVCYRPVTPGLQGVRGLSDTTSKRAAASSRLDQNRCERRVNAYRFSVGVLEVAESLESLGKRDFLDRRHQQPHWRGQRTSSVILR
jgi:hypothetical protein